MTEHRDQPEDDTERAPVVELRRPLNEIVELLPLEQRIRAIGELIDSMEHGL